MTPLIYIGAAFAEIAGCFTFWAWLRLEKSPFWIAPGVVSLALFAFLLTKIDSDFAGRAYAAYGGVYIAASLVWLWLVESKWPPNVAAAIHPTAPSSTGCWKIDDAYKAFLTFWQGPDRRIHPHSHAPYASCFLRPASICCFL